MGFEIAPNMLFAVLLMLIFGAVVLAGWGESSTIMRKVVTIIFGSLGFSPAVSLG